MNKKGQQIGTILIVAIAVILGAIFIQVIAQSVGESTNTISVANESLGVASNATTVYLTDYKYITDVVVVNSSNGAIVGSGNYTLTNNVVYNGALAVSVLPTNPAGYGLAAEWNISGTAQPTTYISESGGRAMASLIIIMFALAVLSVALYPSIKEGISNMR